jgi:hypothetical protein
MVANQIRSQNVVGRGGEPVGEALPRVVSQRPRDAGADQGFLHPSRQLSGVWVLDLAGGDRAHTGSVVCSGASNEAVGDLPSRLVVRRRVSEHRQRIEQLRGRFDRRH